MFGHERPEPRTGDRASFNGFKNVGHMCTDGAKAHPWASLKVVVAEVHSVQSLECLAALCNV